MKFQHLLCLISALILSGCEQASEPAQKKPKAAHLVEVHPAAVQASAIERVQTGTLAPKQTVKLFNQVEGQLVTMPFHEGDQVSEGELLIAIDGRILEAELQKATAQRRKAEKDLNRVRGLINRKLVAQSELTERETELAIAQAEEKLKATQLGYTRIHAPFSGIISARFAEPGDIAEDYSHLMSIVDLSALKIEVAVSELFLNRLRHDMAVAIQIDALTQAASTGEFPHRGRITRIHPAIDAATRTGTVEITLAPIPEGAKPGQFARIRFSAEGSKNLLIPYASLRSAETGEYVFIVNETAQVERRPVNTGLRIDRYIEVLTGLQPGDKVITRGFTNLKPGATVQIATTTAAHAQ